MKTTLVAVKIILVIMITVSIGSVLGAIGYVASIKNNPPIAVQPTPTITQILTPTVTQTLTPTVTSSIDTSDWKSYKNEKYGFEFKYPDSWGLSGSESNWLGVGSASYDPFDFIVVKPPEIQNDFLVSMICKPQVTYEDILTYFTNPNSKVTVLKDTTFSGRNGKIISDFNVYAKKEHRFIIVETSEKSKCTVFQPTVDNSDYPFDSKYNSVIERILSTFAFVKKDATADWKTYKNEKYGFEIKYPQDWVYKEDVDTVYFGTPESISGGYIWGIFIHQPGESEQLISQTGNQFSDRKEVRDKITLNTNIPGTLVTVTTSKYTNWISKKVYFEKNNQLFVIGNGAIIDDRFEIFYKSFNFYK